MCKYSFLVFSQDSTNLSSKQVIEFSHTLFPIPMQPWFSTKNVLNASKKMTKIIHLGKY